MLFVNIMLLVTGYWLLAEHQISDARSQMPDARSQKRIAINAYLSFLG